MTEAKDTVMREWGSDFDAECGQEICCDILPQYVERNRVEDCYLEIQKLIYGFVKAMLEAQAEISFKAGFNEALNTVVATQEYDLGKEVGIKEVVEWFMANQFDREHWENGSGYCSEGCPACRLDKQLKDWGLEK